MSKILKKIQKNKTLAYLVIGFFIVLQLFGVVQPAYAIDPITATIAVATAVKKVSEMLESLNQTMGNLQGTIQEGQTAQMRQFALWAGDEGLLQWLSVPQAIRAFNNYALTKSVEILKNQVKSIKTAFSYKYQTKPLDKNSPEYKENNDLRKVFSYEKIPDVKSDLHRLAIEKAYLDDIVMNLQVNYGGQRLAKGRLKTNDLQAINGDRAKFITRVRKQLDYAQSMDLNNVSVKSCLEVQKLLSIQTNELLLRLYEAQTAENQALAYQLSSEGYAELKARSKKLRYK